MLALERQGRIDLALQLFEEMDSQSVSPNEYVYSALMGDGSDPGAWPRALALLEDCAQRGVPLDAVLFGKALRNCAAAEEWEVAVHLLDQMAATMKVTLPALASAVASCRGGQWEVALALVTSSGQLKDTELWNSVIYSCALAGRAMPAKKILTSMKLRKLEPTVECYNSCLVAICQSTSSAQSDAGKWLTKMGKDGVSPNTVTLNAGIGMFASSGAWEQALAFATSLQQRDILPSQITFGALIGTCKESRSWPAALAILEDMLAQPSIPPSVTAFNIAIAVCESCDQCALAVLLLRRMPTLGIQPDLVSYNTVLAACQNTGEWQLALQLFQELEASTELSPDVYTYSSVISACDAGEQWEWAVNLWQRMEAQGVPANDVIFNSLVSVCKKCAQQEWVDYLLAEMSRRGLEKGYITMSAALGSVTAEQPASEAEGSGRVAAGENVKVYMEKLEGASHLFQEAMTDGAFSPWVREGRLMDLHGMSTEVAKVAVYMAMRGIPDLPEDDLAFTWGLKIIVGKGLHSANGEVVLDPVIRELLEKVFLLRVSFTREGTYRVAAEMAKVVCVTGCTGYVASEVVRQCLELGWTVRGTARDISDEAKTGYLKKMAAGLPGKLELVQADLLTEGAFDTAVQGCEYVFHTASPFFFGSESEGPEAVEAKLIKPAVDGTKNVLTSVGKHKAGIKCVALTSSCAAISGFTGTDKIAREDGKFSEADWNETSTREEKAAWEIAEKEGFKLVTICPSFVLGPANTDRNDGESVGFALKLLKEGSIGLVGFPCIDVRDVGKAHILACTNPNSEGRYILSSTFGVPAWWAYEAIEPLGLAKLQKPEKPEGAEVKHTFCNDKVQSTEGAGLGIKLTDLKTTLADMLTSMKVSHAAHLA
ncbi:TKPR2 [Symbiodinium natans]|uniref:TKPR2 protein n=1 Tax=Symbiodinium natans TaxID=878477 RepID=A0A812IGS8_9DINO|nr:TKPR2 [Symbiodinium natans]